MERREWRIGLRTRDFGMKSSGGCPRTSIASAATQAVPLAPSLAPPLAPLLPPLNKATGGPATEYVNSATGKFVVVDNTTKQVLQVSGPGFLPNH